MKLSFFLFTLLKVSVLLFSAGCIGLGGGDPQPTHYYTLEPVEAATTSNRGEAITIGLDRIEFPDYLDRKEMVIRTGRNQMRFTENDLWAERPSESFQRILSLNIERQASVPVEVFGLPWPDHSEPAWIVYLDVQSFEGLNSANPEISLEVSWSIRSTIKSGPVKEGHYQATGIDWEEGDYASLAAGVTEGLVNLGRLIAKDLEELVQM
ncbi:MAG: membrane integrity-associated transporter subunit PqiC [Verrucomicrobiae bacterium]|nr:membrane integrity-associated transporter subunit PqiC [Verrucomicrobiae bacterium]